MGEDTPLVGVVMGSDSDWPTMQAAAEVLDDFGVPYEVEFVTGVPSFVAVPIKALWKQALYAPANNSSGLGPRRSMPFSSGFPNVISSNPSGVPMDPERPPVETASAVNSVFIVTSRYRAARGVPMGSWPTEEHPALGHGGGG